jgi:hypothetical protein
MTMLSVGQDMCAQLLDSIMLVCGCRSNRSSKLLFLKYSVKAVIGIVKYICQLMSCEGVWSPTSTVSLLTQKCCEMENFSCW